MATSNSTGGSGGGDPNSCNSPFPSFLRELWEAIEQLSARPYKLANRPSSSGPSPNSSSSTISFSLHSSYSQQPRQPNPTATTTTFSFPSSANFDAWRKHDNAFEQ